jgi:cell division protein FtsB
MTSQPLRKQTLTHDRGQDSNVLPFRKSYLALAEAQAKRQTLHRLQMRVLEVGMVTLGGIILSSLAGIALVRSLSYQISQQQKLQEITSETHTLQQQVDNLRDRLPERFGTSEPDSAFLRRHGWLKPNQFVVKFLDSPPKP